jgi:NADPH:quinone reductase-like Zn-dependent oxidoreductase
VLTRYAPTREEAIDSVLQLEDSPLPKAMKLQPREVLVAVRSASVSFINFM